MFLFKTLGPIFSILSIDIHFSIFFLCDVKQAEKCDFSNYIPPPFFLLANATFTLVLSRFAVLLIVLLNRDNLHQSWKRQTARCVTLSQLNATQRDVCLLHARLSQIIITIMVHAIVHYFAHIFKKINTNFIYLQNSKKKIKNKNKHFK